MYRVMYVSARASAKPMNMVPHCECIIEDNIESWWCELIILPRRRMMSPGIGFIEKRYCRGCFHVSSSNGVVGGCAEITALLRRSLIFDDSTIIPN